eukprot:scaffold3065_cov389-Prasinococcus_capsulatus_cf.AAC.18
MVSQLPMLAGTYRRTATRTRALALAPAQALNFIATWCSTPPPSNGAASRNKRGTEGASAGAKRAPDSRGAAVAKPVLQACAPDPQIHAHSPRVNQQAIRRASTTSRRLMPSPAAPGARTQSETVVVNALTRKGPTS